MKTGILKLTAILGVLAVASACSATRTQQSAGEVIDDSTLTSKVKIALIDDPITKAGQINVETYRGVVQLGGFVDNTQQKEQATKVARSITGVKEVRNDLRVSTKPDATAGQNVDDSMLTASVKAKLTEDSTTKAYQINVGTQKGMVQLTGFVDSTTMKARAGELARSVDGVKEVRTISRSGRSDPAAAAGGVLPAARLNCLRSWRSNAQLPRGTTMAIQRKQIVERARALLKIGFAFLIIGLLGEQAHTASEAQQPTAAQASETAKSSPALIADGQRVFVSTPSVTRSSGTDKLRLHEVVEKSVDPTTALSIGLKVDADVLPPGILQKVDLRVRRRLSLC